MKRLQQESYHSNNKAWLPEQIQTLAPYQHIADGFYSWTCGHCGAEHSSRSCGWPIAGEVETCGICEFVNLLVSTATIELDELRKRKWAEDSMLKELEVLRGIKKYNEDQLIALKRELWSTVEFAMHQVKGESK